MKKNILIKNIISFNFNLKRKERVMGWSLPSPSSRWKEKHLREQLIIGDKLKDVIQNFINL